MKTEMHPEKKSRDKYQFTRCAFKVSPKFHQSLIKLWRCSFKVWSNFGECIKFQSLIKLWYDMTKFGQILMHSPKFDETLTKLWCTSGELVCFSTFFLPNFALNKNIHWIPNIPKLRFQHKPCHSDMNMLTLSEIWKCRLSGMQSKKVGNLKWNDQPSERPPQEWKLSDMETLSKFEIWHETINSQKWKLVESVKSEMETRRNVNRQKWKVSVRKCEIWCGNSENGHLRNGKKTPLTNENFHKPNLRNGNTNSQTWKPSQNLKSEVETLRN